MISKSTNYENDPQYAEFVSRKNTQIYKYNHYKQLIFQSNSKLYSRNSIEQRSSGC